MSTSSARSNPAASFEPYRRRLLGDHRGVIVPLSLLTLLDEQCGDQVMVASLLQGQLLAKRRALLLQLAQLRDVARQHQQ